MISGQHFSTSIEDFLRQSAQSFTGNLKVKSLQTAAWDNQFEHLQKTLQGLEGQLIFEYGIPGLNKVIDVVLLLQGKIFVLEYKNWSETYSAEDLNQVNGYALRLKYYHSTSHERLIIPILVATNASFSRSSLIEDDGVYETAQSNYDDLRDMIDLYCREIPDTHESRQWERDWLNGIYKASPTIIQAAIDVWDKQNVKGLGQNDATTTAETRLKAEDFILHIVEDSQRNKRKVIVFVTGVPGAGKTLVGLNLSVRSQDYGASMLSGNDPLVNVLSTALRRNLEKRYKSQELNDDVLDKYERASALKKMSDKSLQKDKIAVDAIIRGVYAYKNEIIKNRLNWKDSTYDLLPSVEKCSQHVIIYDEAQRAWTKERMLTPGQSGKKEWQTPTWPFSEPGILLWDMNQLDWGVFVCLVGGGQEINDGEAGICEWLHTLSVSRDYDQWKIYMAPNLDGEEYAIPDSYGKNISYYRTALSNRITFADELFLSETQRTTRSDEVSNFINKIICGDADSADYDMIKKDYKIYLTRNVQVAKEHLRKRQNELRNRGNGNRIGMLMSSKAVRLRPLGYEVKKVSSYLGNVAGWFLDSKEDNIDSSDFLEVALNEFFVQGLEIDYGAVLWDADFRYDLRERKWRYFRFNKTKWNEIKDENLESSRTQESRQKKEEQNIKNEITRSYMRNAYRVLLTRARSGLVIVVPEGEKVQPNGDIDTTRLPEFYDGTYNYLKSLGFEDLDKPEL